MSLSDLKSLPCPPDDSLKEDCDSGTKSPSPTISEKLVRLGEAAELFHALDSVPFASVPIEDHRETYPIRNKSFRLWLQRQYWREYKKVPGGQAMQDAIETLAAMALHDGREHPVYIRVAGAADSSVFVDLGSDTWQAVKITADGWQVVTNPEVKFRRSSGLAPLPLPERGGSLEELREFVNIREEDFPLYAAWLIGALNPSGPYPVLILTGEQGSTKTTAQRVARRLLDPNKSEFRSATNERDLMIGAQNSWCLAFDNISSIKPWLSDAVCRLSTGSGFACRKLYADDEETIFEATRPILLNGIGDIATRGDLISRALILSLPPIPNSRRKTESEFWKQFEEARPRILGALFDAVSAALGNLAVTVTKDLPRMADFGRWVIAAEEALPWPQGDFLNAFTNNQKSANEIALEASPLPPLLGSLADKGDWQGRPSDLLLALNDIAPEEITKTKDWPRSAKGLTEQLDRLAPNLRVTGVSVERMRQADKRLWTVRKIN